MIFQSENELQQFLDNQEIIRTSKKLAPRPQIVLIRNSEDEVNTRAHIIIGNTRYNLDTVIKAIDTCFKCMWTLQCGYPVETSHVWIFFEHLVYNIDKTPSIGMVTDLIADLKRI